MSAPMDLRFSVSSEDLRAPSICGNAQNHAHEGGFARAVLADEPVYLTAHDRHGHTVDSAHPAERLCQRICRYGDFAFVFHTLSILHADLRVKGFANTAVFYLCLTKRRAVSVVCAITPAAENSLSPGCFLDAAFDSHGGTEKHPEQVGVLSGANEGNRSA